MRVRFYIDPETGQPHMYEHAVDETEVREVLRKPIEERAGTENSRVAIGRTSEGRILKVIFTHDDDGESLFAITAYDLKGKPLKSFRRRQRGRRK